MLYLVSAFDVTLRPHWLQRKAIEHCTTNGNVIRYHLRIIQECFQPKIGRKIRIFSLGRKNKILIKQKKSVCRLWLPPSEFPFAERVLVQNVRSYQPKAAKTTNKTSQNDPKLPTKPEKNVLFTVLRDVAWCYSAWYCMTNTIWQCTRLRVYLSRGHEVISCLAIAPDRLSLIQSWRCISTLR